VNSGYIPGDSIPQQGGYGGMGDQAPSGLWDYIQTIAETIVETIAETLEETREAIQETIDRIIAATQPEESPVPEESGGQDFTKTEDTLEAVPDEESTESRKDEENGTETTEEVPAEDTDKLDSDETEPKSEDRDSDITTESETLQERPLTAIEDPFVPLGSVNATIMSVAARHIAIQENKSGKETNPEITREAESRQETGRETKQEDVSGQETGRETKQEDVVGQETDRETKQEDVVGQETDTETGQEDVSGQETGTETIRRTGGAGNEETEVTAPAEEEPPTLQTLQAVNPATGEEPDDMETEPEHEAVYAMGGLVGINSGGCDQRQLSDWSSVGSQQRLGYRRYCRLE